MAETAQEKIPSLAEQWSLKDKEEKSDQSEVPVEKTTGDGKPADATSEEAVLEKTDVTPVVDATNLVAEEDSETPVQEQTESQEATEEKSVIKLETAPEDFHFPKPADATSEEAVPEKTDETHVADGTNPVAEENGETPEQEETESQEATEEKPVIKLETAPADFRFPTTNQTRHCFTRYIEYHKCIAAKGEGAPDCDKFAKYYRSLCPSEWSLGDPMVLGCPYMGMVDTSGWHKPKLLDIWSSASSPPLPSLFFPLSSEIERWNEQRANGTFPGPL